MKTKNIDWKRIKYDPIDDKPWKLIWFMAKPRNRTSLLEEQLKTIEIYFIHEEAMKINSMNKNSEKVPFNNCENQKSLFHWLEVLEKKICWW